MDEESLEDLQRFERKVDKLTTLTKQNNKMLRRERNTRQFKTFIILLIVVLGSGYAFYFFRTNYSQIVALQERLEDLQNEAEAALASGRELREAINNTLDILDSE